MRIKIHQGTRSDNGENLCKTCRNATRVVGSAATQEYTICGDTGRTICMTVLECTAYLDKRHASIADMRESAFYLVSKNNRTIGFVSAKDFKKGNAEEFYSIPEH